MIEKEKVNSIDFLRLFFALCVVAIHINVMNEFSDKANWYVTHLVFRLGVPFFFVVTGYFLGKKIRRIEDDQKKCMRICVNYIRKLLPPFLFWGFAGLVWYRITLVKSEQDNIVWKVIQSIFFYPRAAMWYVLATIIAVLVIGVLWSHKKILVFLAGGVLLCFVGEHILLHNRRNFSTRCY